MAGYAGGQENISVRSSRTYLQWKMSLRRELCSHISVLGKWKSVFIRRYFMWLVYVNFLSSLCVNVYIIIRGFPAQWLPMQGKCRFDPWVGKIPWRRKWQPTPVFLPGKFPGQRSLVGYYSSRGHKESDMTEWLSMSMIHYHT